MLKSSSRKLKTLEILFILAIALNVMVWFYARHSTGRWLNVPTPPSVNLAQAFGIGDAQLSYRFFGITLQNMGDTGGRQTALNDYNYDHLSGWFTLANELDSRSNFMPFLAAYYFGGIEIPEKLGAVVDYLETVGQRSGAKQWRWLVQAIYIARWKMDDLDRALEIARILADLKSTDRPLWTRQMSAFLLNEKGDKDAATVIMLETLKSSIGNVHPNEINFTKDYICTRILDPAQSAKMQLCQEPF